MFLISPEDLIRSISNFRDILDQALSVNNQELSKVLKYLCMNHGIMFILNYMHVSNTRDDDIALCIYSNRHQLIIIEDDLGNLSMIDSLFILKDDGNKNNPYYHKISSETMVKADELIKRFETMFENNIVPEVFIVNVDINLLDDADIKFLNSTQVKFGYSDTDIRFIVGTRKE